jgi:hypothetical protein
MGFAFPFLITHILRKKRIKGNATDGPITESPHFGRIQWNQSCSHMPRAIREPEMMDVDEPVVPELAVPKTAAPEPAEPPIEPEEEEEEEEEEEYKETITLRASDFVAFQDILEDMRFQIADMHRTACQEWLETQEMLQTILDKLPPASGPSAPPAP